MSKHVKNLELFHENKQLNTPHPRLLKLEDAKCRPQEMNFWKIYTKVPRASSMKPYEQKTIEAFNNEDEKLIVISAFKNPQILCESPGKHYRVYKPQIKRYISDEGTNFTGKTNKILYNHNKPSDNSPSLKKVQSQSPETNKTQIKLSHTEQRSQQIPLIRSTLSGNKSQIQSKYRINKEGSKKNRVIFRAASKIKLPELKEEKKYPVLAKSPDDLKQVKSQSFTLIQYPSQRIIVNHRSNVSLQIASLTKIMTFYTINAIIQSRGIDIKTETIVVTSQVNQIGGTSAQLIEGEQYTIQELLYGLMLPSGNDAANQLGYWAGRFFSQSTEPKVKLRAFIRQMNKQARLLDLKNTRFANAHGLPHQEARSTATDVAKLCCICMKIELFRVITSCKFYKTTVKNGITTRQVQWQNTNKLLRRDGFTGAKTGITVTAGPCLVAAYTFRDKTYISVILRAPKVSARFKQTRLLLHWALSKMFKDLNDSEKNVLKKLKKHDRQLDSDYSEDQHEFRYDCGNANEYKRRVNILSYQM